MKKIIINTIALILILISTNCYSQLTNLDLIKDVNPGTSSSVAASWNKIFDLDNKSYFCGHTSSGYKIYELSNANIATYVCNSEILYDIRQKDKWTVHNNKIYNVKYYPSERKIWEFDGISSHRILQLDTFSEIYSIISFNNKLMISAKPLGGTYSLFEYDGTTLTVVNTTYGKATYPTVYNNELYYISSSKVVKYNGTTFTEIANYHNPKIREILNNTIIYEAYDSLNNVGLLKIDGVNTSFKKFPADILNIYKIKNFNNNIYMVLVDTLYNSKLYHFDGNNIAFIKDLKSNNVELNYNSLNNKIYYANAPDNYTIKKIYELDINNNYNIDSIGEGRFSRFFSILNNEIYYLGTDSILLEGNSLYKYNTTSKVSRKVANLGGNNDVYVQNLQEHNGYIFLTPKDSTYGKELFVLNEVCDYKYTTDNITSCVPYTWIDGNTYSSNNNTATFRYSNYNNLGCDSTVILNFTYTNVNASAVQIGNALEVNPVFDTYQWFDINGAINNATTSTFYPAVDGDYYCVATQGLCSKTSNTISFVSTGIRNLQLNIYIYPNPTNGIVNIAVKENLTSIRLIDITGKTVKTFNPENSQLNVSDVTKGIYFLEVANDSKKSVVKLSIKN